jgi:hypothetical protein
MCDVPSLNVSPSPILADDKYELNAFCLRSFIKGMADLEPKIHFILDKCPIAYDGMLETYVPWEYEMEHTNLGINGSMLRAYNLAGLSDEIVLLQECDYLYQPKVGKLLESAIEKLRLVSPYDHLNFYRDRNIHSATCDITLVKNHHFRTTERNVMTWGATPDYFARNIDLLEKYGYLDSDIWYDLKDRDEKLWVPIPSLATHMHKDFLAPGVEWSNQWLPYTQ